MTSELKEAIVSCSIKKLGKAKAYELATDIAKACDGRQIDEKTLQKFIEEKFPKMLYPDGFAKKCLIPDIKSGLYDAPKDFIKEGYVEWNTWGICNEIEAKGYPVTHEDRVFILNVFDYINSHNLMTYDEAREWVNKALAWTYKQAEPSSAKFCEGLRTAKTISALGIDWKEVEAKIARYKKDEEELNELLSEAEERNR